MNVRIESLLLGLRRRGVLTSREMQEALGVSAATLSRLMAVPEARPIVRLGRARSTRYALRRELRGAGSCWPLYQITRGGDAALVGQLFALTGGRWLLQQDTDWPALIGDVFRDGLYPGLPWFLQDLRPRGFLGRLIARHYAGELGVPPDPRDWSDDDTALFLLSHGGSDLPGAFVLGRRALALAQLPMPPDGNAIPAQDRLTLYPELAAATMAGAVPGSSAAGEQPKFTTRVRQESGAVVSVIVKFSGAQGRPEDERWSDLLTAEHVANRVLVRAGISCATTEVLQAGGRCFLESSRFDRVGQNGRCGFVSLEAFDGAFFGEINTSWDQAAVRYGNTGWLSGEDAERLSLLWWFGTLIGNTDMHYGNVGLYLDARRPLALAPVYDMVPMLYRPDLEGRLPQTPVIPVPPSPEPYACWSRAVVLARDYWQCLSASAQVSASFREIAARNVREMERT